MLLPVWLAKLLVKSPVQVSSILQWRATAQQDNICLVYFEQLPGFQSLQGYIHLKDIFIGKICCVKIKLSLFLLFREIELYAAAGLACQNVGQITGSSLLYITMASNCPTR